MPDPIDAVKVSSNRVAAVDPTPTKPAPVVDDQPKVTMNSGGAVTSDGFVRDVKTPAPVTPAAPAAPADDPGVLRLLGRALNPLRWPKAIAARSKKLARFLGWTTLAAGGGGGLLTAAAFVARHLAPQAVHQALASVGLYGVLGPQSAALLGAGIFGVIGIAAALGGWAFLRAGRVPKTDT